MVQNQLSSNFDQVFHPGNTDETLVNGPASNDLVMLRHFETWLQERKEKKKQGIYTKPFYAQFYHWNAHYPLFVDKNVTNTTSLKEGMLITVDKAIENIFELLSEAGELDNTIVIGSGDHGENYPERYPKESVGRLRKWTADILHPPLYMYVPRKISEKSAAFYHNLRYNTRQLISTLDIFPTLMHLLHGNTARIDIPEKREHCVRGFSLLDSEIAFNRTAWSFTGMTMDVSKKKQGRGMLAMHHGTSSSLMNRYGYKGKSGISIVRYHDIIDSLSKNNETKVPLKIDEWKAVIQNMIGTNDEIVLKSEGHIFTEFVKNFAAASEEEI
jgi:hypothetical protein